MSFGVTSNPTAVKTLGGTFEGGGIKGSVKLSFAMANEKSANIWLTFVVGGKSLYVPVEGDYLCSGETCEVKATVIENIPLLSSTPFFKKGDRLSLAGKKGEKLVGALTSETNEIFKPENPTDKKDEVKYKLELLGSN